MKRQISSTLTDIHAVTKGGGWRAYHHQGRRRPCARSDGSARRRMPRRRHSASLFVPSRQSDKDTQRKDDRKSEKGRERQRETDGEKQTVRDRQTMREIIDDGAGDVKNPGKRHEDRARRGHHVYSIQNRFLLSCCLCVRVSRVQYADVVFDCGLQISALFLQ